MEIINKKYGTIIDEKTLGECEYLPRDPDLKFMGYCFFFKNISETEKEELVSSLRENGIEKILGDQK